MFWRDNISPDNEPNKLFIKKGDFIDNNRNKRVVPYKLYYPDLKNIDDKIPLVIWSHGLGGSRDGAGYLARFLASHKYIVLNIQHIGTDSSLWEGKTGHPWDNIRKAKISRKTTLNRMKDVPFIINQMELMAKSNDEIAKFIDFENIGMSGHSFGAITTQIMAGQKLGKGERKYSMKEHRIKAAIAYSPSETYNSDEPKEEIYGSIDIPMFYMTGTNDDHPVNGKDYLHRLQIYENAKGSNQHLLILKDGDHMVYNGSRGGLGNNPKLEEHKDIIKISALAFWDSYLKNMNEAREWLQGSSYKNYLGKEGEYRNKNI